MAANIAAEALKCVYHRPQVSYSIRYW